MATSQGKVAEFQGLYGPFTVAEHVVQRLWLRGDFERSAAVLADGRRLEILSPGEWNRLGGPDFLGARLRIGGVETTGDVEVHFHASDWAAHGHGANPAYAGVVLHVVLFPPGAVAQHALRSDGSVIPMLVLLPLLHRDMEEYAADDALEAITARDEWRQYAGLAERGAAELQMLLREHAAGRWERKVHYARQRIGRLGWDAAAHATALEILGYRHNRSPMLEIAARHPLEAWGAGLDVQGLFADFGGRWQLHGVRPANHPLPRLRQYQAWIQACPDWPGRWAAFVAELEPPVSDSDGPGRLVRAQLKLPRLRDYIEAGICGGAVGGTRLDTLVCDGLLPLAAAEGREGLFAHWFHWYLGDVPDTVRSALTRLGVAGGAEQPHCHGHAQGLLGWLLGAGTGASH